MCSSQSGLIRIFRVTAESGGSESTVIGLQNADPDPSCLIKESNIFQKRSSYLYKIWDLLPVPAPISIWQHIFSVAKKMSMSKPDLNPDPAGPWLIGLLDPVRNSGLPRIRIRKKYLQIWNNGYRNPKQKLKKCIVPSNSAHVCSD